jgi:hypothetical protein
MDIKLFDNRILAPAKCGTRHLRKIFKDKRFDVNSDNLKQITHIVIRNPYEHFESAIHTEYVNFKNTHNSIQNIEHILRGTINENGIGHWNPKTYRFLYSIFIQNPSIQIIELSDLSNFLASEGYVIPHNKSEYDWSEFGFNISKEFVLLEFKNKFKQEFEMVNKKLEIEMIYYTKLLNMSIEIQ